jgi:putative nucleotidyltransferase with HDIG domain
MKKVDVDKVTHVARNSVPLTIKTYTLPHETELYLEEILGFFLKELGQEKLKDPLAYCMRELAVNAKKANTKRIYFQEKNLKLLDDNDYKEGMKTFKQETLDNIDYYMDIQKKEGLYVKVIFHTKGQVFNLYVCNNTEITRKEQMRVYDRIARSRAFDTLEEVLSTVLDDSEGAGLGIVILILMLKKVGLDEDSFDIDVQGGETIAKLTIPMSEVRLEKLNILSEKLVNEIETLPRFPENIVELQKMISDPNADIQDIARHVSMDPALTADLLRIVNSAAFMLPKKVDNIVEAVKMVGMRMLKNQLYSYGTQKILGNETRETKKLWRHSYKTAFYAYNLVRSLTKKKEILDDVYVGGILHDMGKIIFSSVHPELIEKIENFSKEKNIPQELFESMVGGLNHSVVGALVAEKWNFPDALIAAIRYHINPLDAPPEFRDVVFTVYLANALCEYESEVMSFDQLEKRVLQEFRVKSEEHFKVIQQRLQNAFEKEAGSRQSD